MPALTWVSQPSFFNPNLLQIGIANTKDEIVDGALPGKTFEKSSIFRATGAVSIFFKLIDFTGAHLVGFHK